MCKIDWLIQLKMNNLRDMYYLFQLIIHQIFVFLRDIILHEFPRFLSSNVLEEVDEKGHSKIRGPSSMKNTFADFVACFIICSFLGVLVFLSAKSIKEDEDDEFTNKRTEAITVDLPEDPIYHFPQTWALKANKLHHERGDEYFSEENESPRKETLCKNDYKSTKNSTTSSFFGTDSDYSQHSQRTQITERKMKKAGRTQHWLIRKTRSGHVYGKYPL